jgi:hypothetical protein
VPFSTSGSYRSHSLLLSLIYNLSASAATASGDADVPGWLGDPGDGHLSGSAAAASPAATSGGTRRTRLIDTAGRQELGRASVRPFFMG